MYSARSLSVESSVKAHANLLSMENSEKGLHLSSSGLYGSASLMQLLQLCNSDAPEEIAVGDLLVEIPTEVEIAVDDLSVEGAIMVSCRLAVICKFFGVVAWICRV